MTADLAIVDYLRSGRELRELAESSHDPELAAYARAQAKIPERAAVAEAQDVLPVERPWCACPTCQGHLLRVRWERISGQSVDRL